MTIIPKFKYIFAQKRKQKRQSVFIHPVETRNNGKATRGLSIIDVTP